ncbi:hypothetical protein PAPYR_10430 [Paratrimastix pyriformis]|uniref:Hyaluronan/mRNA-binding protein domain-containing protein n=1 Tax=Paratrimastix pyriformis TaxID=342808 RepID=A0ABQ8U5Z8_9EUKA|nr:hypothetical protein PAPYR_10430 [Paratrimastix pyriformis]|eukprot:GAFH01002414.1.p2 GENE.GAFH01002414.1~~GAFH01002414.1.p2  ORF type:complete len:328 (+),score=126.52 GAFH01002414.1:59-985(+)
MATRIGTNMYALLAEEEPQEAAPVQTPPKPVAAEKKKPVAKAPVAAAPAPVKEAQKADDHRAPREHHQRREDVQVREGKRVFERHSAPGRGRPAPKEGHNSWGKPGDEARETPVEEHAEAPATEEKPGEEKAAPAEPTELDLATFLKKQAEHRVVIPLPEARRAGEGQEPDPAWEQAEELEHEEDEFYHGHKGKKAAKKVAKKEEATPVSLSSFLADSQAGQQLANRIERERRDRQRRERATREETAAATTGAPAPAPRGPASPRRNTRAVAPARPVAPPKVDDASFPSLAGKKAAAPVAATAAPVAH